MSVAKGTPMGGVRSFDDLRERCWIDTDTGCWIWRGGVSNGKYPNLWMPAVQRSMTIGQAIGLLKTGEVPGPSKAWHSTCRNSMCANPDHRRGGTRATQMKSHGIKRDALTRAKISASKRVDGKLSEADADDIRDGGMTLKQITEKYGICVSYACQIRAGIRRGPQLAQGASVFAWRPAP